MKTTYSLLGFQAIHTCILLVQPRPCKEYYYHVKVLECWTGRLDPQGWDNI